LVKRLYNSVSWHVVLHDLSEKEIMRPIAALDFLNFSLLGVI
jgi:hypothetical protein